jgi:hypothetical protein
MYIRLAANQENRKEGLIRNKKRPYNRESSVAGNIIE